MAEPYATLTKYRHTSYCTSRIEKAFDNTYESDVRYCNVETNESQRVDVNLTRQVMAACDLS